MTTTTDVPKRQPTDSRRRKVIHASCSVHKGARGFTNLVVSKRDGEIQLDSHADTHRGHYSTVTRSVHAVCGVEFVPRQLPLDGPALPGNPLGPRGDRVVSPRRARPVYDRWRDAQGTPIAEGCRESGGRQP